MKVKSGLEKEYSEFVARNSKDPYSKGVVDYTERWADAMETAFLNGETVATCARRLSHEVDTDGITGFMYGCAVQSLANYWEHGEALRLWHNLDTQIGNEGVKANESGGVLNPALMNLGGKK